MMVPGLSVVSGKGFDSMGGTALFIDLVMGFNRMGRGKMMVCIYCGTCCADVVNYTERWTGVITVRSIVFLYY